MGNDVIVQNINRVYMQIKEYTYNNEVNKVAIPFILLVSVSLTFLLFFIDEGYYDLRWAKSSQNWIIFFLFVSGLFIGQSIIDAFCVKNWEGKRRKLAVLGLGLPLGIVFTYIFLYGLALLRGMVTFMSHV